MYQKQVLCSDMYPGLTTEVKWKDPTVYRLPKENEDNQRPRNKCDYRSVGGPLLSYVWCSGIATSTDAFAMLDDKLLTTNDEKSEQKSYLQGQTLYLGAEISSYDDCVYCIPGHAERVLRINPRTDCALQIGPTFIGKFKWLRGVELNGTVYGIPCHAATVLKIDVPNNHISELHIQYESIFPDDADASNEERYREWKYHGGNVSPVDGCIYAIPQSARFVLKIDPKTDTCTLIRGPKLDGRYQFYGGVVGKQDGAIYGIPHNSPKVLRIHPIDGITLHGNFAGGAHKWHGGAAAPNGVIVCVPANSDTILCITPVPFSEPILTLIGDETIVQSGRHRTDRKYKYLGATAGPDGRVYCFPCAAEFVLAVDTVKMTVHKIGPNIYDTNKERLCQNKWQNGVYIKRHKCIFGIPLAAESILQIDFNFLDEKGDPIIRTWPIPAPHRNMAKWEGAVVAYNDVAYSIPNNDKASLRIELPVLQVNSINTLNENAGDSKPNSNPMFGPLKTSSASARNQFELSKKPISGRERPDQSDREGFIYNSGIPTLRASAHRVKFSPKDRKHNPCPKNSEGKETGTVWLPPEICREDVFSYDLNTYNFPSLVATILKKCDTEIVGKFREGSEHLEDFVVNPKSIWRCVNGGQCEKAQKYLSDTVSSDESFLQLFDKFVLNIVLPYLKKKLTSILSENEDNSNKVSFYIQRPPTLRLQPGPAWAQVKAHNDAEYGHQYGELNFWLPLTNRDKTAVDLYCESSYGKSDYHPIKAMPGEIISFHGSSCRHFVSANSSESTRVSFDFRIGVQGFFDPTWEMQGTDNDHLRHELVL